MSYFYIPPTKKEIITELIKRWPDDKPRFKLMHRSRLVAIFIKLRQEQMR